MKHWKKMAAVLLAFSLTLGACGNKEGQSTDTSQTQSSQAGAATETGALTKEEVFQKNAAYYEQAEGKGMKLKSVMTLAMSSKKEDTLTMSMDIEMDAKQNAHVITDLAGQTKMEQYVMEEEDKIVLYQGMDKTWYKMEVEPSEDVRENYNKGYTAGDLKLIDNYTMEETADGYQITGDMTLQEAEETYPGMMNNMAGSPAAEILRSEEVKTAKIHITSIVDKTDFHTKSILLDLTDFMKATIAKTIQQASATDEAEKLQAQQKIEGMSMTMEFHNIEIADVQPIVVPEEAKNAQNLDNVQSTPEVSQPTGSGN